MPKYFIFSRRKRMCLYNLYSESKSELFGFERGVVDGARDGPQLS